MMRKITLVLATSLFVAAAGACANAPDDTTAEAQEAVRAEKPSPQKAPPQAAKTIVADKAQKAEAPAKGDEACDCKHDAKAADEDAILEVAPGAAPVRGSNKAPVTIVVFSDFQCPFCSRAEETIRALENEYQGRIRFAFRNNPLPFHENARLAAKAALAAAEQGKFWEYHDALFSHQSALDRASLEKYAADLGLDVPRFSEALGSDRIEKQLQADEKEAARVGAKGTPLFFVNGKRLIGAQPIAAFRTAVDAALARR
jgi:protein-disulfide isomerase